jgi:hypothetical protein
MLVCSSVDQLLTFITEKIEMCSCTEDRYSLRRKVSCRRRRRKSYVCTTGNLSLSTRSFFGRSGGDFLRVCVAATDVHAADKSQQQQQQQQKEKEGRMKKQ